MNRWTILAILAVFVGLPALVAVLPKRPPPIEYNVYHPTALPAKTTFETGPTKLPDVLTEPLVGRACDYSEHGCSK